MFISLHILHLKSTIMHDKKPVVQDLNMLYICLVQQVLSAFKNLRATGKSETDPILLF